MSGDKRNGSRAGVGVIGGGPWGVALALAATRTGADVILYTRRDHPEADKGVRITTELAEVAKQRLLVVAVPSSVAREVLRSLGDHLDGTHLLVHGVRGLSGESLETVSDLMRDETAGAAPGRARRPGAGQRLTEGRPSAMVCGSRFPRSPAAVTAAFQATGSARLQDARPARPGVASALVVCCHRRGVRRSGWVAGRACWRRSSHAASTRRAHHRRRRRRRADHARPRRLRRPAGLHRPRGSARGGGGQGAGPRPVAGSAHPRRGCAWRPSSSSRASPMSPGAQVARAGDRCSAACPRPAPGGRCPRAASSPRRVGPRSVFR